MVVSLILHWLHLLGVVTWIGGLVFNLIVLTPSLGAVELKPRAVLLRRVLRKFLHTVWGSLFVIIATGLYRVLFVNQMTTLGLFLNTFYGNLLIAKILLVTVMILIAAYVTLVLYPPLTTHLSQHETETFSPQKCQTCRDMLKITRRLMLTVAILGFVVILVAAQLRGA